MGIERDLVEFKELHNTAWPLNDYELQSGVEVDKDKCKEFYLRNCFCAAVIYNGNRCWKKKFPLSNGIQSLSVNRIALIKVPRGNLTSLSPKSKDKSTLTLVGSFLLGSSVFLNFVLFLIKSVAVFLLYHKKLLNLRSDPTTFGMRRYTFKELEEAIGASCGNLAEDLLGPFIKAFFHQLLGNILLSRDSKNLNKKAKRSSLLKSERLDKLITRT